MNPIETGKLIRTCRKRHNLTQQALGEKLNVSDKAVSKWERGLCAPDVSLFPELAEVLGITVDTLLSGEMEENPMNSGNMKKSKFYVCPTCGNLVLSWQETASSCCGRQLKALDMQIPDEAHMLQAEWNDGEWYITGSHEMRREHFVSFVALLNGDTVILKKLYPEWNLETRLPGLRHGLLVWYCTGHGLFGKNI